MTSNTPETVLPDVSSDNLTNKTTGQISLHDDAYVIIDPLFLALHLIVSVLIISGNGLTIYVIIKNPALRTQTNFLVVSLSVSDILLGILLPACAFMEHSGLFGVTLADKMPCVLCKGIYCGIMYSSVFGLFTIALDRYIAVNHSLRYLTIFSKQKVIGIKTVLWSLAIFTIVLFVVTTSWQPGTACLVSFIVPAWLYYSLGVGILLSINLITVIIYVQIFIAARKQRRKIQQQNAAVNEGNKDMRQVHKSTKMMALILGLFELSWMPFLLTQSVHRLVHDPQNSSILLEVFLRFVSVLAFSNSFWNPVVYGWKNKQFRKAYKEVLSICCRFQDEALD